MATKSDKRGMSFEAMLKELEQARELTEIEGPDDREERAFDALADIREIVEKILGSETIWLDTSCCILEITHKEGKLDDVGWIETCDEHDSDHNFEAGANEVKDKLKELIENGGHTVFCNRDEYCQCSLEVAS